MPARIRVDPINLDFDLMLDETVSPAGQSQVFADFAESVITAAKVQNQKVLGRVPPHTVTVDGRLGAPLNSVKPGGVIFAEFELVFEALDWIGQMLRKHSPFKSGRYRDSHVLLADGEAVDAGKVPPIAQEYVFVNIQPYSRKIERGLSSQAPDGVYQSVAQLAASTSKFGNVARVKFGYRTPLFGAIDQWANSPSAARWAQAKRGGRNELHPEWLRRQPAIIITLPG